MTEKVVPLGSAIPTALTPERNEEVGLCRECVTPLACYSRREAEDGYCLRAKREEADRG